MITVPEAAETIIRRSRYLQEALSKDLINYSSLARYIKPELETMTRKPVSQASVLMAVQRISKDFNPKYASEGIFKKPLSFSARSNLLLVQTEGSHFQDFLLLTQSDNKIMGIIDSSKEGLFTKDEFIDRVCAITIDLPREAMRNPSTFYFFLKSFAWEGINILQVFSTLRKLTLVVNEKDLRSAVGILQSLWNEYDQSIDSIV